VGHPVTTMNRKRKTIASSIFAVCCLAGLSVLLSSSSAGEKAHSHDAGALAFQRHCAVCHIQGRETWAPTLNVLHQLSRGEIVESLTKGAMKVEGSELTAAERKAVADFLSAFDVTAVNAKADACVANPRIVHNGPAWNGWGFDTSNTRFEPGSVARLTASELPSLKLKWAFGFPGAIATYGQPTVYGGRVFAGSEDGTVYSLDAKTGCVYWTFKAPSTVKTAVSVGLKGRAAFFGDVGGNVYAVDSLTGKLMWQRHMDSHPAARITGSPVLWHERLYVPVSSGEEGAAIDPKYPCCTFRGSVVALDAKTGKVIWKTYTIPEAAHPTDKNPEGTQLWGPAGAAVWSPPTINPNRRELYAATGNSYCDPVSPETDAVMAMNINTGKVLWVQQFTPDDRWNTACVAPDKANCPKNPGSDYDFGSPPILVTLAGGKTLLIAAQKSGMVYALDPARRGHVVWSSRIGNGGPLGGIQWGGAGAGATVFFPLSDWVPDHPEAGGGLFALEAMTGKRVWYTPAPKPACLKTWGCSAAQMAPSTAIPGVVFSGSLDGHLRAYDMQNGAVLWDFNSAREFRAVNGVKTHGGSLAATGPAIVDGMLFINAGYTNALDGNALLAFAVEGK
jgi:polyvinyl alcohol dehydrogenase (cytochrome)